MPPWRAIGYTQFRKDESNYLYATPKLAALSNHELVQRLVPSITRLGGFHKSVEVQTDWMLV